MNGCETSPRSAQSDSQPRFDSLSVLEEYIEEGIPTLPALNGGLEP